MIKDRSEYVELVSTPQPFPLAFSPGGFYRIGAKARCRACGRTQNQAIRSPRYMLGRDGEALRDMKGRRITLLPPDPSSEKTIAALLLAATEHMVGCWDNPISDLGLVSDRTRPGRHTAMGKCGLYGHKTCVCGYVWKIHGKECPTAMVPRVSRMILAGQSSSISVRGNTISTKPFGVKP